MRLSGNLVRGCGRSFSGLTSAGFMKQPSNEPILSYLKGSAERKALDEALAKYADAAPVSVPCVIGDEEFVGSGGSREQPMPFEHKRKLASYSYASRQEVEKAIDAGLSAREAWEAKPLQERADVMLRAADLAATKYRMDLMATTMLGQGKTIIQGEIDSTCELIDFFRFNAYFALQAEKYKPLSPSGITNRMIYRGLEGFVAAISPFNFTAIGGNLASCPAMMGNTVMWKPSDTAILSNWIVYKILREAGLPPNVVQFLPADGPVFGDAVTDHPSLACVNFTGSVPTFRHLWRQVGEKIDRYQGFPRLIGECGGKNFHFVHPSADLDTVAACTVRAAFEYQGQKCSANSRAYVPQSLWPQLKDKLLNHQASLKVGAADAPDSFLTAVIDQKAFDRIASYLKHAKDSPNLEVIAGGKADDSRGFFVEPTIVESKDPEDKIMREEIFGPVLTVYAYPDGEVEKTLESLKDATPFGLTGAVFAQDKSWLSHAEASLRDAVGNLYLNDKCTGSIVGQQPFGGARLSGTNDKAGGPHYALKFASPQTIKEAHTPLPDVAYPYMKE